MYVFTYSMDKQQGPTVQHRKNHIQYPMINRNAEEYVYMRMCICITESRCYTEVINTTL